MSHLPISVLANCRADGLREAEALEPEWLRAKIAADARETARLYELARSERSAG